MNQLEEYFKANAQRNLFLTVKLLKLLKLFQENGIISIPYKGPIIAKLAYNNVILRQFNDLDILFHKNDILLAKEILISHGYRPQPKLTQKQELVLLNYLLEHSFINDTEGIVVDIHWRVAPKYFSPQISYEYYWEHLKPVSLLNKEILTFSPEDLLLILCIHGTRNLWNQLYMICDVAKLISVNYEMDWKYVLNQSNNLRIKRFLLLGLHLANNLLGTKLPEEILKMIKADSTVLSVASFVHEEIFSETFKLSSTLQKTALQLKLKENLWDKFQFCFHLIIMVLATDCKFLHLPKSLNFLCKLLQPIRFCIQNILSLSKNRKNLSTQNRR